MARTGRPTLYSKKLADEICTKLAEGKSMRSVCREEKMPEMETVWRWLREKQDFNEQYVRATQERTEAQNELLLELGDQAIALSQSVDFKASNAVVSAVKLKADNLRWSMSKMKPKKYGDKVDLTSGGEKLPTPILYVPGDNSHPQDNEPQ